ncbi:MAG: DEAD/DEAH box helicase family protein [Desulfatirhabdiaceae bacterium]
MLPELRPYQIEALDALGTAMQTEQIMLLQAIMGSGKTAIAVRFLQRYFFQYPDRRFLILMGKSELVGQFEAAFKKFTNIKTADIGVCCSGLGRKEIKSRITIATVQTLKNSINSFEPVHLTIVDETHNIGTKAESQYQAILSTLFDYNSSMKVLGLTASAYRLGYGYIYGDNHKPDEPAFFPKLTHRITYARMLSEGHLVPLEGFIAANNAAKELKSVDLIAGDYNLAQAGKVMSRYLSACVDAVEEKASEHEYIVVAACTIDHAEKLQEVFTSRGHAAIAIHSKQAMETRKKNIENWKSKKYRIVISIYILSEGWDFPPLSCLVFARPTASTKIFIQYIGRILRTAPGKEKATLIDLTGNSHEFGFDLDNLKVTVPRGSGDGEAPSKICPFVYPDGRICGERVHAATRFCPACEYEWTVEEVDKLLPELKKVSFGAPIEAPLWHDIAYMSIGIHTNQETGKRLLRLQFECRGENIYDKNIFVSEWLCFPDWYQGFAVDKGKEKWELFSEMDCPDNVETAKWYADESFVTPKQVLLKKDGKWHRIEDYKFDDEEDETMDEWVTKQQADNNQPFDEELPF